MKDRAFTGTDGLQFHTEGLSLNLLPEQHGAFLLFV
ncbi:MAG: hypothetical protein BWY95_01565 [Bacteroidetes bacterium ADurb.BinA104]|nr:MAG: hypothetical protein BWY95_01565 [Bacteroidetes bacterium ADurb.BinA104]